MKLIVAGSRTLDPGREFIYGAMRMLKILNQVTEIVSGTASGVDRSGEDTASQLGIALKRFPANWVLNGKAAGPKRNKEMAAYGDALLLVWDGKSRGSASMKREMKALGKPVYEIIVQVK